MNFGLLKQHVGDCAKLLGLRHNQKVFCPEECPLIELGIASGHQFHCQNDSSTEIAHTLNFLVDLTISSYSVSLEKIEETIDSLKIRINNKFDEQKDLIEKLIKSDSKSIKDDEIKKDNNLNKAMISLGNKIKSIETKQHDYNGLLSGIAEQIESLSHDKIISSVRHASSLQSSSQNKEFEKLKKEIKNLIEEIRFDPNNPKPTEIATEKNSEKILELSKNVIHLVNVATNSIEKTNDLLQKLDKILIKMQEKIGGFDD